MGGQLRSTADESQFQFKEMQKKKIGNETKDKNSLAYNLVYSRLSINSMNREVLAEYYERACQERCSGLKIKN